MSQPRVIPDSFTSPKFRRIKIARKPEDRELFSPSFWELKARSPKRANTPPPTSFKIKHPQPEKLKIFITSPQPSDITPKAPSPALSNRSSDSVIFFPGENSEVFEQMICFEKMQNNLLELESNSPNPALTINEQEVQDTLNKLTSFIGALKNHF